MKIKKGSVFYISYRYFGRTTHGYGGQSLTVEAPIEPLELLDAVRDKIGEEQPNFVIISISRIA